MTLTRIHLVIPEEVVGELDRRVGRRGRSQFVASVLLKELDRLRLRDAIADAAGAAADVDVPGWESADDAVAWVRRLRDADADRIERLHGRDAVPG